MWGLGPGDLRDRIVMSVVRVAGVGGGVGESLGSDGRLTRAS